ncbi:hypothetical protein [Streptomyces sp. NPDC014685]|uniref:hypothetical protein n=1 Tax=Streptomyces sp. NPDC014685 TaxID=3364881 RepID=UPI0037008E0B
MGVLDTAQLGLALTAETAFHADQKILPPVGDREKDFRDQIGNIDPSAGGKTEVFFVELEDQVQPGVPHTICHK